MKYVRLAAFAYCIFPAVTAFGQHYHGIQGSPYAGGLGVHGNPASIVSCPFPWDLTLMGAQISTSSNAVRIRNYSLLKPVTQSEYILDSGTYARYADFNFNLNLLNFRVALGRKRSIAAGINLRGYGKAKTGRLNFIDTLNGSGDFLLLNEHNQPLQGTFTSSSWIEIFASYAQTILENRYGRLQAGITLRVSRGVAGVHAQIDRGRFSRLPGIDPPFFLLDDAAWNYGYSSNFDHWLNGNSRSRNLNNFLAYTEGGGSLDLGVEFLIRDELPPRALEEDDYFDYRWKIGLALLDFGFNQFKYGRESSRGSLFQPNTTNLTLDQTFDSTIRSVHTFNDSLAQIAGALGHFGGGFRIYNPLRLSLNVDHPLERSLFINAELTIDLTSIYGSRLAVSDMGRLLITPRWENERLGVYLPFQYNSHGQAWLGLAFRTGPLLLGIHNLGHIFSSRSFPNGGGYIALIFRSPQLTHKKYDKRLDCPPGH